MHPRDAEPIYSVVKHGPRGWFWVAWPTLYGVYSGDIPPAYEGTAATEIDAHNAARGALGYGAYSGPLHGPGTRAAHRQHFCQGAQLAQRVLRKRATAERMSRPARQRTAQPQGVVYKRHHSMPEASWDREYISYTPHRIIRSSARFVWVDAEPALHSSGWYVEHPEDLRTYRLDRAALAAGGYSRAEDGWWGGTYVLTVPEGAVEEPDGHWVLYDARAPGAAARTPEEIPACLRALGLVYPCTAGEADRAYKAKALGAHPDTGGSHEAFLALGEVYAAAQRFVR